VSPADAVQLERYKREAAERAVEWVASGMVVGLGAGTTTLFAVRRIGRLLREGQLRDIVGVPCSRAVEAEARQLGIPLSNLKDRASIDLTIDGADEVDPELNLIKGGGGALLREKIVAQASRREIIVVDETKRTAILGTHRSLPVEVVPFGWSSQANYLERLGARVTVRRGADGRLVRTDQGNLILDCMFGQIVRPAELAVRLDARAGIVEHGLFLGMATDLIVSGPDGINHLTCPRASGDGHAR
jgi:ribose 5-phosphate isomerase A